MILFVHHPSDLGKQALKLFLGDGHIQAGAPLLGQQLGTIGSRDQPLFQAFPDIPPKIFSHHYSSCHFRCNSSINSFLLARDTLRPVSPAPGV